MLLETAPFYVALSFGLTALLTLGLLLAAIRKVPDMGKGLRTVGLLLAGWMALIGFLAWKGFFLEGLDVLPPRFGLTFGPPLLVILLLFLTRRGRAFIDQLQVYDLTLISVVRVPVEIVLYWLFLAKAVPELMTFAGRNFDILAGISAPIAAIMSQKTGFFGRTAMLVWTFISLGLLLFIVINAILSAPTPLQQFGFEQPNIGVFYFPYIWLPGFVVPVVLFANLAALRKLLQK